MSLRTEDYNYYLPEGLIASRPVARRDSSRLLVVHRDGGHIEHKSFQDFSSYFQEDELLVFNNTRVVPSRFFSDDGKCELLRTEIYSPTQWRCMVRPGKRFKLGRECFFGGVRGVVQSIEEDGQRVIQWEGSIDEEKHGHLALPPYMGRGEEELDRERYQTVFAAKEGAIAAPTAGLHFTPEILAKHEHAFLTLHVGAGTFKPVSCENLKEHKMHCESFEVGEEAVELITQKAGKVVAVGTTVVRVLEHLVKNEGRLQAQRGETSIFIYPPYQFKVVNSLLTNFHLPKSTLLMLVSAFAGQELIKHAYEEAVREEYRFYSYGDAMLIL